jgi:hypothetical protein
MTMLEKFKDNHDQKESFSMFLTSTVSFLAQKTQKSLSWCQSQFNRAYDELKEVDSQKKDLLKELL